MDDQISTLLDSAHAINDTMHSYRQKVMDQYNQLQLTNIILPGVLADMDRHATHIKQCLADAAYQDLLTTDQLQQLSACVTDADMFMNPAAVADAPAIISEPVADVSVTPDA
jgi:hypothetical protein